MNQQEFITLRKQMLEREYGRLNDMQREAVFSIKGPLLVLAGAGSGKTSVLTSRMSYMMRYGDAYHSDQMPALSSGEEGHLLACAQAGIIDEQARKLLAVEPVNPYNILAITFTNKAAREMRERLERMHPVAGAWVCTFHAACVRILRTEIDKLGYTRSFTILDADDQTQVIKEILKAQNKSDKDYPPREIKAIIGSAKTQMLSPDEHFAQSRRDYKAQVVHDLYVGYERRLKEMNALDFDDLLLKTLELFSQHPPVLDYYRRKFQYVLVDEYQDTNHMQYMLIRLLAASKNLCVVGDDDQSIYGWRGADIRNILDFEKDYDSCKVVKLEQNYRSTNTILQAANQVIDNNFGRKKKTLWSQREQGEQIQIMGFPDEQAEAAFVVDKIKELIGGGLAYSDIALLYRANAQSRVPEEHLVRAGIPHSIYGGMRFYERKEVKDVVAYLRAIENPLDDISLRRIINEPKRSIGDTTVAALMEHCHTTGESLFSVLGEVETVGLSSRASNAVAGFYEMMSTLIALKETLSVTEFVRTMLEMSGLTRQYELAEGEEAAARIENIKEMISAVEEYEQSAEEPSLMGYLEGAALMADVDGLSEGGKAVTLMTLHSAKGLEFPVVFMLGMEDGLFPNSRAFVEEDKLEEERRLCYVGITRAKDTLYMTYAMRRSLFGNTEYHTQSRFIQELPSELCHSEEPSAMAFETRRGALPRSGAGKPERQTFYNGGFTPPAPKKVVKPAGQFATGDKVIHDSFGAGTVIDSKGDTIRVAFPGQGIKVLSASLAPMKKA